MLNSMPWFLLFNLQDTSSGGVSDQFTIHYQSGVDFICQFNNTASPPTFSWSSCGSDPFNYTIQQFGPAIVGNTAKVSIIIGDPKLKCESSKWKVLARGTNTVNNIS